MAHAHNKVAAKVTIAFFTVLEFLGVQGWIELEELTHHGTAVIHALDPQFEEPEGLPVLAGQAPAMIVEKVERVRQGSRSRSEDSRNLRSRSADTDWRRAALSRDCSEALDQQQN